MLSLHIAVIGSAVIGSDSMFTWPELPCVPEVLLMLMMLRGEADPKVSCSVLAASLKRGDRARMSLKGAAASRERQQGQQQLRPESMSTCRRQTEPPGLSISAPTGSTGPATVQVNCCIMLCHAV